MSTLTADIPTHTDWQSYEKAKAELGELTPEQYEQEIRKIVKDLEV